MCVISGSSKWTGLEVRTDMYREVINEPLCNHWLLLSKLDPQALLNCGVFICISQSVLVLIDVIRHHWLQLTSCLSWLSHATINY